MLSAMRSPALRPSFWRATAHLAASSSNWRRETVTQSTGAPRPLLAARSQRSPSKMKAASAPWPASTWRSSSLKAALVRPPSNQRKLGASSALKARVQGAKSSPRSAVTGAAVSASQPAHWPSAPRLSQAGRPATTTSQCRFWAAILPWNAPGSASTSARMPSQSARVRTGFTQAASIWTRAAEAGSTMFILPNHCRRHGKGRPTDRKSCYEPRLW